MAQSNPIKRLFDLYTSDLSYEEIERLIKKESSEVYEFFARDIAEPDSKRNKFIRILIFIRNLFNAFLLKLTPARRIVYIISLFFIIIGVINDFGSYLFLGIILLNVLLAFELVDKLLFKDEITFASKIHNNLIPKEPPVCDNFEIATYYESAKEISGDYFDFIDKNNGKGKYAIVGDISGKGLAAALYMVRVQAILVSMIDYIDNFKDVLINLNKHFIRKVSTGFFLTLNAIEFNNSNKIKIYNAGHTPCLIYKSSSNSFEEINPKGIGIGLQNGKIFDDNLEYFETELHPNDIVILYTDGITEAMDEYKNQFGIDEIKKLIKSNGNKNADLIIDSITSKLRSFRGDAPVHDDSTMIIFKVKQNY